ncbi:MAG: response regulator transcription factor [SAR202 cluster bacterium]|nr:response regulator transcription factor [SAR202 cluster bacterium]
MTSRPSYMARNQSSQPAYLAALEEHGIAALVVAGKEDLDALKADDPQDVVLIDAEAMPRAELKACARRCAQLEVPAIAMVPERMVASLDTALEVKDFIVSPPRPEEMVKRVLRATDRPKPESGGETIKVGDLIINPTNYEVSLRGRSVNLRFKEYELLHLMATNPGRVFTREMLLERIWGYDYLGGTRTVDVHVRRLRSKIEDADNPLIETVWNVGYRFKDARRAT